MNGGAFEWDENKNRRNIEKHGFGFERAKKIFRGILLTEPDTRQYYGEKRYVSFGVMEDIVIIAVVHTERDGSIRIISARKASAKEREKYLTFARENR